MRAHYSPYKFVSRNCYVQFKYIKVHSFFDRYWIIVSLSSSLHKPPCPKYRTRVCNIADQYSCDDLVIHLLIVDFISRADLPIVNGFEFMILMKPSRMLPFYHDILRYTLNCKYQLIICLSKRTKLPSRNKILLKVVLFDLITPKHGKNCFGTVFQNRAF